MFLIRDTEGKIYNKVNNPAIVYDSKTFTRHKIGEKEDMIAEFDRIRETFKNSGFINEANDICYIELPHNQEMIDDVFNTCDYIKKLHNNI